MWGLRGNLGKPQDIIIGISAQNTNLDSCWINNNFKEERLKKLTIDEVGLFREPLPLYGSSVRVELEAFILILLNNKVKPSLNGIRYL